MNKWVFKLVSTWNLNEVIDQALAAEQQLYAGCYSVISTPLISHSAIETTTSAHLPDTMPLRAQKINVAAADKCTR